MSAFSGKKMSSAKKVRDFLPEYPTEDVTTIIAGRPRSVKKYLPVRISSVHWEGPSSLRKSEMKQNCAGMSSIQPIRNIHKLLESPKRNARKRLDNLYDVKTRDVNSSRGKPTALSEKKLAPKTPAVATETKNKAETKTPGSQINQKSRQSRLLQPGTISGSYVNKRNSLAPRTSLCKPSNNRFTIAHTSIPAKRPSDVAEESPQPLESSRGSSEDTENLGLDIEEKNQSTKAFEKIEITGEKIPPKDEKKGSFDCSENLKDKNSSNSSENISEPDSKTSASSQEIVKRPTVIVMQEKAAPEIIIEALNEGAEVQVEDGSYSEILSVRKAADNFEIDESLLFKHTEKVCSRYEVNAELNGENKLVEMMHEVISSNDEILEEQRTQLIGSISHYEENLNIMKSMLKVINEQLEKRKIIESKPKSKEFSNLNEEELSPILRRDYHADNGETSSKENLGSSRKRGRPKGSKNKKSQNFLPQDNDEARNVLRELNETGNRIENSENQPSQRRRSARLADKSSDKSLLLPLNKSTPVTSKNFQTKSKPCTPSATATPARNAKLSRRSERPLREYLALKSAVKFLKTPDSKRYQIGSDENIKIPDSVDKNYDAILTNKLMREFHELYSTP